MNEQTINQHIQDKFLIRELLDNWVIWSDGGFWDLFSTVWHENADMSATWYVASASEFIKARRSGWEHGISILHTMGGTSIEINKDRAIAMSKMSISQRGEVHGVLCDVLCTGRFYDFLSKKDEEWKINRRRVIYEKDRIDPVIPGSEVILDKDLLKSFPDGYRHLAYLQTQLGYEISSHPRPGIRGAETDALYNQGRAWLNGSPLES